METLTGTRNQSGSYDFACPLCGAKYTSIRKKWAHACERERQAPGRRPHGNGVGDCLHRLFKKYTGQDYTASCGCRTMVAKMNKWGPNGCRVHKGEIVRAMRAEAKRRRWWKVLAALPGASRPIKWLVNKAINEAEAADKAGGTLPKGEIDGQGEDGRG